ncbi:hypothetical protein, partial [Pseudomonas aeruginosa]|uniref:hypothetical protein n=1 Tax=Pseudomonas aeruginosa TaxID=287 RepID=UPI001C502772
FTVGEDVPSEHTCDDDNDADNFSHRRGVLAPSGSWTYWVQQKTLVLLIGKTAPDYSPLRRKANSARSGRVERK